MKRAYLVELRKKTNLTQKYVATKLSIKQNTFSMIENGQRRAKLTLELINGFSEIFDVPITQIIELESKYQEELKASREGINACGKLHSNLIKRGCQNEKEKRN